jgi:hypothetical protein
MRFLSCLSVITISILPSIINAQNVGMGTATPTARLHVTDSSVLFSATGTVVMPAGNPPISGPGRRMMWYADKAAFRVGEVSSTEWDMVNIGTHSFAAGERTMAMGNYSVAFGYNTSAFGQTSVALGSQTRAEGHFSYAFGVLAEALAHNSMSMGLWTKAESYNEIVMGAYNSDYTPNSFFAWNLNDRLFVIGNGTSDAVRSDALVVLKSGKTGIGISTPSEALDVAGNIKLSGNIQNEAFIAPTLVNGWINYGAPHTNAAYYKDKEGRVHLRGLIKNGTATGGTILFTLPAGYRPSTSGQSVFAVISNNALGRVDVKANGDVVVIVGTNPFLSLDGISFRAD